MICIDNIYFVQMVDRIYPTELQLNKANSSDSLDIMRQTACLVVNPIIVDSYASLFNCTTAVRASDSLMASAVWDWRIVLGLARRCSTTGFHLLWHTVELPWVLVFVYHSDYFDFYVFVLIHWLSWEPLCELNFMYFCIKSSIGTQGEVGWP